MKRTSTLWQRIAGSVVGLLIGGAFLGFVGWGLVTLVFWLPSLYETSLDQALTAWWLSIVLATLLGATVGAALGATFAQKLMKQRSSLWRTMLVSVVAMLAGVPLVWIQVGAPIAAVLIVLGAVLGSGWKARPISSS